jgi:hypothetical protein
MSLIYFITDIDEQYVKIGQTTNIETRMRSLSGGSPLQLKLEYVIKVPNTDTTHYWEDALHQQFARHWSHGEWFYFRPPIKAFIWLHRANPETRPIKPPYSCRQFTRDETGACLSKSEAMAILREVAAIKGGAA